ncbi:hypothetical protein JOE59_003270 [Agromyces cerinus]|uniref:hypothetical protein n=1 Tax=Agromyces cerinus TaxID=33878 RepID=UPI00195B2208|nr:hypothetical protein [Agromyces cerinus]MBM7832565.1 hypothetical protein [Agromyces cerinus]
MIAAPAAPPSAAVARSAGPVGVWALPLITLGFVIGVLPALVFVGVLVVFTAVGLVTGGLGGAALVGFLATLVGGGVLAEQPWLVILPMLIGVAAFTAGIIGSVTALRRRGIPAPNAVTWSAAAIGLVLQLLVNGAVYFAVLVVALLIGPGPVGLVFFGGEPVPLTIFVLLAIVATAGLGWLLWSLFGRAFGRRTAAQRPQAEAGASMTS